MWNAGRATVAFAPRRKLQNGLALCARPIWSDLGTQVVIRSFAPRFICCSVVAVRWQNWLWVERYGSLEVCGWWWNHGEFLVPHGEVFQSRFQIQFFFVILFMFCWDWWHDRVLFVLVVKGKTWGLLVEYSTVTVWFPILINCIR